MLQPTNLLQGIICLKKIVSKHTCLCYFSQILWSRTVNPTESVYACDVMPVRLYHV